MPTGNRPEVQIETNIFINTVTIVIIDSTGANANTHFVGVDWYEHTDKN